MTQTNQISTDWIENQLWENFACKKVKMFHLRKSSQKTQFSSGCQSLSRKSFSPWKLYQEKSLKINFNILWPFLAQQNVEKIKRKGKGKVTSMRTVFGVRKDKDGNNKHFPRGKRRKLLNHSMSVDFHENSKVAALHVVAYPMKKALKEIQCHRKKKDLKENKHRWTPCGFRRRNKQHFAVTKFQFSIFSDMIPESYIFHHFPI